MKRIRTILFLIFAAFSVSLAHTPPVDENHTHEHQQQKDVVIKTEKVAGNIYVLFGQGGNIGVSAGKDGILMIDDQFEPLADKIKAALKELGSERPRFVFNTHWHGDHTGGNVIFGADSIIVAHENVRKRLSIDTKLLGEEVKALPAVGLPMITYAQGLSVYFNGERVRVVYFPNGHTDGDSVLFFDGSNVVHLGDDFFAGRFPFVDLSSGGSVEGLARNVGELIKQIPADARIIPGHGPLSNLEDLKNYHRTITETTALVREKMKTKTLDAIKKEGLPEKYKEWGSGFINTERWIETIYNSYSIKSGDK